MKFRMEAIVTALQSGHLAEESVVSEAFFTMENVALTPHIGGATREQRLRGRLEAATSVAKFLRGEPVESVT